MRAALYLRQSVFLEEGIERQRERTTARAKERRFQVVDEFTDNEVSASRSRKGKGEGWDQLLAAAHEGRIDIVVCVDLDRLLRSITDLIPLIDSGLKILTVDDEIDLDSPDGEFRATMLVALARFEVRLKSRRQLRANEYRDTHDIPIAGKRRYGYLPADRSKGIFGNTKIRKDEALIVREIFEAARARRSIRSIAADLTSRKVPFHDKVSVWTPRRVRSILSNPCYRGAVIHNGVWRDSVNVDTIIETDLWDDVRDVLEEPERYRSPGPKPVHLLTGLMICGTCGEKMRHTGKMYYCRTPVKGHPSISDVAVEDLVIENVVNALQSHPSAVLAGKSRLTDPMPLRKRIEMINEKMVAVTETFVKLESPSSVAVLNQTLRKLDAEKVELEGQLEMIRVQHGARWMLAAAAESVFQKNASGKLSLDSGPSPKEMRAAFSQLQLDVKRDLVEGLIDITLYPGRKNRQRTVIKHKIAHSLNADFDPVPTEEEWDAAAAKVH
ncbi:hypothetical protein GCM10009786_11570 [Leucobacter alluvii]|uniref:DNA invertase Pin-like site-specific DNA recombinase n=1 Tax=Leucobacter alluvii TaxID=340321 RepID=A0ABN3B4D7_9MICO